MSKYINCELARTEYLVNHLPGSVLHDSFVADPTLSRAKGLCINCNSDTHCVAACQLACPDLIVVYGCRRCAYRWCYLPRNTLIWKPTVARPRPWFDTCEWDNITECLTDYNDLYFHTRR